MKRTPSLIVGLVLSGLLGLSDVVSVFLPIDGPPVAVVIGGAVLGVVTLVGVVLAWRGSRTGAVLVIVSRLLSALTAVPVFFVDDAPEGAAVPVAIGLVVTLLAVALVAGSLRTRTPVAA